MYPQKLKKSDEVRIIAPSKSLSIISKKNIALAKLKLEMLGLKVTFSKHSMEINDSHSSSINSRVNDIHTAFKDKNVKCILAAIGGFNSNQLLNHLDYNLIKSNPKIFCGYSDITALQNAIYTKTGLITYSGPTFSSFAMKKRFEYTKEYFRKCLMNLNSFEIVSSKEWSDDMWYLNQENRIFIKNDGAYIINKGNAKGKIIGGNLCTLNLLQGTEFMPNLNNSILFIEDDKQSKLVHFDRDLQSLINLPDFKRVKSIVIGRFQKNSEITKKKLINLVKNKCELNNIPIIANLDFGHTSPMFTFPIGGIANLKIKKSNIKLEIVKH